MKTVLAFGYFDSLNVGHVEYLNRAAALGNRLVVLVFAADPNSLQTQDKLTMVRNLKSVYRAFVISDLSAALPRVNEAFGVSIFARDMGEVPDAANEAICKELGIEVVKV